MMVAMRLCIRVARFGDFATKRLVGLSQWVPTKYTLRLRTGRINHQIRYLIKAEDLGRRSKRSTELKHGPGK